MNSQTKSAIKSLVLDLRHTLEKELAIALRRYGLFTDRDWSLEAPPDRLTDEADRQIWRRIVTVVRQRMQEGRSLQEASQDYVRESAFTFLNRLVGLKCLEVRGIIDETITTRDIYGGRSKAHRDYREAHPRQARAADDALPACLEAAWRHVNEEMIGYLFDPDDDHSLVWPRYAVLKRCIARINELDEAAWAEDEIIGWIYQFYNAEEKVAVRDRGKPQTPHDVAVINQFFTPRWIVKFLVDNTLGRLWLEIHPGSERVREKCDYLVPEPSESASEREGELALDPDSPINNPEAEPRREEKPLPQIRLLDPACGTMHFGHYAMEVFDCMYRDARDWGHLAIEDREIPGVILQNNLFGVDIDRRAVQLAALSLFMKARTMHPEARVTQVNLVSADATLPDGDVRETFLEQYARTPKVQEAFAQVLEDMDQVAELGSLLRVEERLRELLTDAGQTAAAENLEALDPRRQRDLPGLESAVRQMGLADLADDEEQAAAWTPHYTLRELRDDLRKFARRALDEHDLNAQLFATEADKAVRLLDVLMGEYDVVVMNPPYGQALDWSLIPEAYKVKKNIYCAFLLGARSLLSPNGYVGALTDRTYLLLISYAKFRKSILHTMPILAGLDLGWNVLDDANVATVAAVFGKDLGIEQATFIRCLDVEKKEKFFLSELTSCLSGSRASSTFSVNLSDLDFVPMHTFCYWAPSKILRAFRKYRKLEPGFGIVRKGLSPGNTPRFVREHWEIQPDKIGMHWWASYANGGSFSPYYRDNSSVVLWRNEGKAIKAITPRSVIRSEDLYGKPGLTYGKRHHLLNVQFLEKGHVFSNEGYIIRSKTQYDDVQLAALLNSFVLRFTINLISGLHKEVTSVKNLPIPEAGLAKEKPSLQIARTLYHLKQAWDTGNEICTRFTAPWLLQLAQPESDAFAQGVGRVLELLGDDAPEVTLPEPVTLDALLDGVRAIEQAADARLQRLQAEIDEAVYDLYEISPSDRELIERELGDRPPELVWPQMEGKSDRAKREEHVKRFIYTYALQAMREDDDGIVPLAGCAAREPALMDRVRARLEATFGPTTAYDLEREAAEYIGRDVEKQMHTYFFHHFHAGLYKKRPILWHLTSDKKYFAVMLDYHRLDRDTLPKVRSLYLWPQMEEVRTRLAAARADENVSLTGDLEEELEDLKDFEERLETVIEGQVKVKLPKWANGPYRNGQAPYDPDLDDGVKVNLLPIQKARLLPVKKVV